jgi:Ser/Thr protein kinase RdoA (MazF antagonist)
MWTRALAEAGVAVPIGLPSREGADYVATPVPALGETRQVGMARWTEGELLGEALTRADDLPTSERAFEQLGAIAAAMHNQSAGWRPPPTFTRRHLDRDGLMGETPNWGAFWDHAALTSGERSLFLATRDRLQSALDRFGRDAATYGVIHADLHPDNVLVGGGTLTVIDFDDTAFGWFLYDIAVALFHLQRSANFAALRDAFVRGYRTRRDLGDDAVGLIPMFLLIRGLAQIGWLHQRPEIDASAHIRGAIERACAQCETVDLDLAGALR